jgi:hypothetical protein
MNSRKTILLYSFLAAVILAPLVVVAGTVYDRLAPNVYIGQGSAVAEKMVFDTGHSASNAQFTSDGSGNMSGVLGGGTFTGTPAFSGNVMFSGNPNFTGSPNFVSGNPQFSGGAFGGTWTGTPTFSGVPNFSAGLQTASGGAFKVEIFSGTIAASGTATVSITGQILGYEAYQTDSTSSSGTGNPGPITDPTSVSNPGTNQPWLQTRKIGSNSSFHIINADTSFSHVYVAIVFYQ